ncbi:DUF4839 domain-containing protein [Streptococcus himalayensis]|uniref:DUF4839 domain-containing protein n=1 Tax=Streptococcus himalayensis TaxID=1888195 RepID=A0A917EEJ3_9STRE|nr:DUF4839 domain-containing protein [Streptococcus himalayensis]GGE32099.1 hypothetical protein GCM10011510_11740 [Streptococcus himalayensis]
MKSWKYLLVAGTALFLVACSKDSKEMETNTIKLPITSENIHKQNYKTIVNQLKDAGFTNVKVEKIEDLITGLLKKDGQIESVSINGDTDFIKGSKYEKDSKITVTYHTFKEDKEDSPSSKEAASSSSKEKADSSSSSKENTSTSASSKESTSSKSEPSTSEPEKPAEENITAANNPDFAAILTTEDPLTISTFVEKYKDKTVEFDGHVALLTHHENKKYYFDILIYAGDYQGPDVGVPGPAFQFYRIYAKSSAFSKLDGLQAGQNIHIKARIASFTQGEVFRLDPLEITPR